MRTVTATTWGGLTVCNNIRTCAERRLLERLTHLARVHGVAPHRVAHFVRRTVRWLVISRTTQDGERACSLPCLLCRRQLEQHHIRWEARDWEGTVTNETAGRSKLTQRQARSMHPST
jgi:hypothetical protein